MELLTWYIPAKLWAWVCVCPPFYFSIFSSEVISCCKHGLSSVISSVISSLSSLLSSLLSSHLISSHLISSHLIYVLSSVISFEYLKKMKRLCFNRTYILGVKIISLITHTLTYNKTVYKELIRIKRKYLKKNLYHVWEPSIFILWLDPPWHSLFIYVASDCWIISV